MEGNMTQIGLTSSLSAVLGLFGRSGPVISCWACLAPWHATGNRGKHNSQRSRLQPHMVFRDVESPTFPAFAVQRL